MPAPALALAAVASTIAAARIVSSIRGGLAVTHHRVPWTGPRTVRVAHLTDLHVGPTTPRSVLARAASVVAALEVDLVVLTGDYVNVSLFFLDRLHAFVELLPKPCIATLGNHDHFASATAVAGALEDGGARVLRNASTRAALGGATLTVVGVDDGCSGHADVARAFADVAGPAASEGALVLSHFPNVADAIAEVGARVLAPAAPLLVLSGHTHAGQVHVPHVTPRIAKLAGNPYLQGFHRLGPRAELYVNAGLGHSAPGLRAGRTAPEIAVFALDPAAESRRSSRVGSEVAFRRR